MSVANAQGRLRLTRSAAVLEALTKAARSGADIGTAVAVIADLDALHADAALIRRTIRPGRPDVLGELSPEYRVFKQVGDSFLANFTFNGQSATGTLRTPMNVLIEISGVWRKAFPPNHPLC